MEPLSDAAPKKIGASRMKRRIKTSWRTDRRLPRPGSRRPPRPDWPPPELVLPDTIEEIEAGRRASEPRPEERKAENQKRVVDKRSTFR